MCDELEETWHEAILTFVWRCWGRPQKISIRMTSVPVRIWIGRLANTAV
jgi:hypothetical protein